MIIQFHRDELDYVNAKLSGGPDYIPRDPDSFLSTFLMACLRADADNYELLRPVLKAFMKKYPADPRALEFQHTGKF